MSVETIGLIDKVVSLDGIYDFITAKYDISAKMSRPSYKMEEGRDYCTIGFEYNNNDRILSVGLSDNKEYKCIKNDRYIWMSLGQGTDGIKIITDILSQYGGYIDENDSDLDDFYYIEKNPDENIKPVYRVSILFNFETYDRELSILTDYDNMGFAGVINNFCIGFCESASTCIPKPDKTIALMFERENGQKEWFHFMLSSVLCYCNLEGYEE